MSRLVRRVALLAVLGVVALSACDMLGSSTPPAGDHTTVIPITTGGDSGSGTLMGILLVVAILGVAVAAYLIPKLTAAQREVAQERQARQTAEDAVVLLTGQPMSQITVAQGRVYHPAIPVSEPTSVEMTKWRGR